MTQFLFDTAGKLAVLARGALGDPMKTQERLLALVDDIRREATVSQSFAERERDLLLANNRMEQRARDAERMASIMGKDKAEATEAFVSQFISMGRRMKRQRDTLKSVIAIAEEKLADMVTFDAAAAKHGRTYDPGRTAEAAAAISLAKELL